MVSNPRLLFFLFKGNHIMIQKQDNPGVVFDLQSHGQTMAVTLANQPT